MTRLAELLLAELEREAVGTRRTLERVPEGKDDWKPHEKSMPLGYLATLVAIMPSWIVSIVTQPELDIGGGESCSRGPPAPTASSWRRSTRRWSRRGRPSAPPATST